MIAKKVCMLGTFGVGKTSLVRRFVHQVFDDRYLSTIGVQIFQKEISVSPAFKGSNLKLILWDLAHIDELTQSIKNYFSGAAGAIVIFDLTRQETFDVKKIHLNAFRKVNPNAKVALCGNKTDLLQNQLSEPEELKKLSAEYDAPVIMTSAKNGENVEQLFLEMAKSLLT